MTQVQIEGANGVTVDLVMETTRVPPSLSALKQPMMPQWNTQEELKTLMKTDEFKKGNWESMAQLGAHMGAISA